MRKRLSCGVLLVVLVAWAAAAPRAQTPPAVGPIVYTVRFPAPDTHVAEVEATVPTGGRASVELMMPVWTPGFYRAEDYARKVKGLAARTPDGKELAVGQPRKNRWKVETGGAAAVVVSYKLLCDGRSVTTNWLGDDL